MAMSVNTLALCGFGGVKDGGTCGAGVVLNPVELEPAELGPLVVVCTAEFVVVPDVELVCTPELVVLLETAVLDVIELVEVELVDAGLLAALTGGAAGHSDLGPATGTGMEGGKKA